MRKFLIAIIIVGMFSITAMARDDAKGQEMGKHRPDYIKELGLSEDQMETIKQTRKDMRRDMIKLHSEIKLKQLDFEDELQKENPDKQTLNKIIDELAGFKAEHEKQRLNMMVNMVEVLTPKQRPVLT